MLNKLKNYWLFNIFLIGVFSIFLYASIFTFCYLKDTYNYSYQIIGLILFYLFFFLTSLYILNKIKLNKKSLIIILTIITLIGIGFRIFSLNYFKTIPTSDFAIGNDLYNFLESDGKFIYHENKLEDNFFQIYFARYPSWFTYDIIVYKINSLIGNNINYLKILNIILYIFTNIFLYLGVKNLFNEKIGLLSSFIFSLIPSLIVYNNVQTPDHFTVFLMSLIIFTWSIILKSSNKKKYILTFILVFLMSLINLFKPIGIYMLLVFIVSEIFININNIKSYLKNNYQYFIYFIIMFLSIYILVNKTLNNIVENYIKNETVNSTSAYLIWGYSLDDNGKYNSDFLFNKVYKSLKEKYQGNLTLIYNDLSQIAKENIKNNLNKLPYIWNEKLKISLHDETSFYYWANTSQNEFIASKNNNNLDHFALISNSFMIMIYLMISLVSLLTIFNNEKKKEISIILLMIIGYLAILVLGGVQGRYKAIIFPQFAIICSLGIYLLAKFIKKGVKKC